MLGFHEDGEIITCLLRRFLTQCTQRLFTDVSMKGFLAGAALIIPTPVIPSSDFKNEPHSPSPSGWLGTHMIFIRLIFALKPDQAQPNGFQSFERCFCKDRFCWERNTCVLFHDFDPLRFMPKIGPLPFTLRIFFTTIYLL